MWRIEEHRRVDRQLSSVPRDVLKRYGKWQDIASISGPGGLRRITGFRDEALAGQWRGFRSSRLNLQYRTARRRVALSVGESVRIVRELQELSQNQLAALTGIPQTTISAIENDRVNLGVVRAKVLARALKCHPAVLVFPGWDEAETSAA